MIHLLSSVVVGVNDGIGTAVGNELDSLHNRTVRSGRESTTTDITYSLKSGQVSSIRGAGHAGWHQALHQEGHTEDVHARISQDLNLISLGPGVVCVQSTGDAARGKFSTGLVHADPSESIGALLDISALPGRNNVSCSGVCAGHSCGAGSQDNVSELHCRLGNVKESECRV